MWARNNCVKLTGCDRERSDGDDGDAGRLSSAIGAEAADDEKFLAFGGEVELSGQAAGQPPRIVERLALDGGGDDAPQE